MDQQAKTPPRIDELEGIVELDDRLDLTFDPIAGLAAISRIDNGCMNSHNIQCCACCPGL